MKLEQQNKSIEDVVEKIKNIIFHSLEGKVYVSAEINKTTNDLKELLTSLVQQSKEEERERISKEVVKIITSNSAESQLSKIYLLFNINGG